MRVRVLTVAALSAALMTSLLLLSGCAAQPDEYSAQTAQSLQSQVLEVTQSSAEGDPADSLGRLDELVVSLDAALARGEVSEKRYASITAAISLVRTDLEAAVAAQQEQNQPTAPATDEQPPSEKAGHGDKSDPPGKKKDK